jgi:asparaginyl-tRNA synthetase
MSTDFLRTIPHLRMRTTYHALVNRTRSQLMLDINEYFARGPRPAAQVLPPVITSSDCEGAGEAFTIAPQSHIPTPNTSTGAWKETPKLYFREPKYLTVSSQLHLEAHCAEQGDVYAFSPTFRAEESDTPRHLSEFYMLEAEYREIDLKELMYRVQQLLHHLEGNLRRSQVGRELLEYTANEMNRTSDTKPADLQERWTRLASTFVTVDYSSAIEDLIAADELRRGQLFTHKPSWASGLQLEHERWIVANMGRGNPVFVTNYPKDVKPFYMQESALAAAPEDCKTVACFDLLLPHGYCEVVGGSLREHRLEHLILSMRRKGLLKAGSNDEYPFLQPGESLGNLKWYADLRRFGSSPHGGFGLGFDRLVAYLVGAPNLREVVPFPRSWGRAEC